MQRVRKWFKLHTKERIFVRLRFFLKCCFSQAKWRRTIIFPLHFKRPNTALISSPNIFYFTSVLINYLLFMSLFLVENQTVTTGVKEKENIFTTCEETCKKQTKYEKHNLSHVVTNGSVWQKPDCPARVESSNLLRPPATYGQDKHARLSGEWTQGVGVCMVNQKVVGSNPKRQCVYFKFPFK